MLSSFYGIASDFMGVFAAINFMLGKEWKFFAVYAILNAIWENTNTRKAK